MQVMGAPLMGAPHKYKTNASYGCTIDVLISIKQMLCSKVHHWCTHKYKTNASYGCTIISIKQMQVMGAPLMYS